MPTNKTRVLRVKSDMVKSSLLGVKNQQLISCCIILHVVMPLQLLVYHLRKALVYGMDLVMSFVYGMEVGNIQFEIFLRLRKYAIEMSCDFHDVNKPLSHLVQFK